MIFLKIFKSLNLRRVYPLPEMAAAFGDPNMPPIPPPPFNRLRGPEERGRGKVKGKVKFERFLR